MFRFTSEPHFNRVSGFLLLQEIAGDHREMPVVKYIRAMENRQADFRPRDLPFHKSDHALFGLIQDANITAFSDQRLKDESFNGLGT